MLKCILTLVYFTLSIVAVVAMVIVVMVVAAMGLVSETLLLVPVTMCCAIILAVRGGSFRFSKHFWLLINATA